MSEIVVFGVSHLDLPVRDIARALRLYVGVLGFTERAHGDGWADVDAGGTVQLRFIAVARPEHRAAMRVMSASVEATAEAALAAGCERVHEPVRTPQQELIAGVRDPDGHLLTIWRPLSEDEYDFVPLLPTEMTWAPDAEALMKSLLASVPALFRGLARRKVVRMAEQLAGSRNLVAREEVVRGFILASPRVTRGRNRAPLQAHGIDVDRYQTDWDAL